MNTFTIKNGVLTVGGTRVILAQVCAYEATQQTLVIFYGNQRQSLNMGTQVEALAKALDEWFNPTPPAQRTQGEIDAEFDEKLRRGLQSLQNKMMDSMPEVKKLNELICPTNPQQ